MEREAKHQPNYVETMARLFAVYGPMALKYMNNKPSHFSDLIYDVDHALKMAVGDEAFVLVCRHRTMWFPSLGECDDCCQGSHLHRAQAIIKIERTSPSAFRVNILETFNQEDDKFAQSDSIKVIF